MISRDEVSQSQVTAVATHPEETYYCCGREGGSIVIHESIHGKKVRKVYSHSSTSSVTILSWSHSGKYIVSANDSGRVIAKRLEMKEMGKWAVFPVFDFRSEEPIRQFVFSEKEKLLLVSTPCTDCVWDLKAKREICRQKWNTRQSRRWIQHPLQTELLIWINPLEVHTYSWMTLEHSDPAQTSPPEAEKHVRPSLHI